MENRQIPNEAVKVSSSWTSGYEPWQARLNNIKTSESSGSWSARQSAIGEYLQIDLGKERVVNKIAPQGRPLVDQWVKSYKLLFSTDGANWNEFQNNGVVKVNAVKKIPSLAAWVTILNSNTDLVCHQKYNKELTVIGTKAMGNSPVWPNDILLISN